MSTNIPTIQLPLLTPEQFQILKSALEIQVAIMSDSVTDELWINGSNTPTITADELKERKTLTDHSINELMIAVRLDQIFQSIK
jgi:hypothetical protein